LNGSQQDTGRRSSRRAHVDSYDVISLDFDGVVSVNQPEDGPILTALERLIPERVAKLNTIVARTGCKVLVSSTWRYNARTGIGFDVAGLTRILRASGFEGEVSAVTPWLYEVEWAEDIEAHRGEEILAWCAAQPVKPRALVVLVVLDDLALRGPIYEVLVRTDDRVGLTDADVDRVVELLTRMRPVRVWEAGRLRRTRSVLVHGSAHR
jgi:hypothetical protein